MSQHDMEITNTDANTGITFRAAVNAALQALASSNSGASAPTSPYPLMTWADTVNKVMKLRNAANTSWISLFKTDIAMSDLVRDLLDDTTAAAFLETLGLDVDLLTTSLPADVTITDFAKTLLDDEDAGAMRETLGTIGAQLAEGYALASGTDEYTASMPVAITEYVTGHHYFITFTNANTEVDPTLDIDGVGAKTIVKDGSEALVAGNIPAGHAGILKYDGTNLVLLNPAYVASDLPVLQLKTGQYTGDGTTAHDITGVGFAPDFIIIVDHNSGGTHVYVWFTGMLSGYCLHFSGDSSDEYLKPSMSDDAITAVGSDGFTVDDDGGDKSPNTGGATYDYFCIGS